MNSDEIWLLQLWSGVIGATISALFAAGVALLVVNISNGLQRKLAATALAEQKAGLRLQLDEQRLEATRVRQIDAVAEFVSAVELHSSRRHKTELVMADSGGLADMRAAWTKLRMAGPDVKPLALVLAEWPSDLSTLFIRVAAEREYEPDSREARDAAISASSTIAVLLPSWLEYTDEQRTVFLETFKDEGQALKVALEELFARPLRR